MHNTLLCTYCDHLLDPSPFTNVTKERISIPPVSMDNNFEPVDVHRTVSMTKLSQQQVRYQRAANSATFTTIKLYCIRYDSVYLTCSKKLTGNQLSLPHGINKKLKCETKNKMIRVICL